MGEITSYAVVTTDDKTKLPSDFGLELKDVEVATFLDEGWKKWQAAR